MPLAQAANLIQCCPTPSPTPSGTIPVNSTHGTVVPKGSGIKRAIVRVGRDECKTQTRPRIEQNREECRAERRAESENPTADRRTEQRHKGAEARRGAKAQEQQRPKPTEFCGERKKKRT